MTMVQEGESQRVFSWNDDGGFGGFSTSDAFDNTRSGFACKTEDFSVGVDDGGGSIADTKHIQRIDSDQQVEGLNNFSGVTSPLGLTLTKSPSFLDLIETKVIRRSSNTTAHCELNQDTTRPKRRLKNSDAEKLKASNVPALQLRIGSWERVSRNDGDLVAKCYFAKRKLVWEMLEGGLKNKIEINWSEISAIRAEFPENQPGILEIQLSHVPSFQRETDPQPRKHTLWQATSDFTGGQAPICRRHYIQFREGELEKHYEKLLQCDKRLFILSQRPFPFHDSPYFNMDLSGLQQDFSFQLNQHQPEFDPRLQLHSQFGIQRLPLAPCHQLQMLGPASRPPLSHGIDSASPLSFINFHAAKENEKNQSIKHLFRGDEMRNFQNFHMEGGNPIQASPMSAYHANEVGHGIPRSRGHLLPYGTGMERPSLNDWALQEIADQLLSDQVVSAVCSDEPKVLAKVMSMYSLMEPNYEQQKMAGQTCTNYMEYGHENSTDNSVASWSSDQSNGNGELSCQDSTNWCPAPSFHSLMQCQQNPSLSYAYLDQAMENFTGADPGNGLNL